MRITTTTTTIALVALVMAEPHAAAQSGGTVIPIMKHSSQFVKPDNVTDFDALDSHVASIRAKIQRGLDNYKRNTGMSHPAFVKGRKTGKRDDPAGASSSNGISLTSHKKELWYGAITIGTPPKSFLVDIDTGTGDLFVPSHECKSSACVDHSLWDPARSSTAEYQDDVFEASFIDGAAATGDLYVDNVTVAGYTADIQAIGVATTYTDQFAKAKFPPDGSMGMAFGSLSSSGDDTIIETLVYERKVPNPVFSLKINSTGGELYIGGANRDLYLGDFFFANVAKGKRAYWQVQIQNIIGRGRIIMRSVDAIIDSGTSLVGGYPSDVLTLHRRLGGKRVPGKNYYSFPCNNFPTVSLTFGGNSFPISHLNLGRVPNQPDDCTSGIVELDVDAKFWIIGGVFLRGVYTMFDVDNSRVGFAKLAPELPSSVS